LLVRAIQRVLVLTSRVNAAARFSARNHARLSKLFGTGIADRWSEVAMMSLVRLLGFTTLGCGCVTGHYREVATNREITYVEEKGTGCSQSAHRRNHTLAPARMNVSALTAKAS
jgi:hypothetical protein